MNRIAFPLSNLEKFSFDLIIVLILDRFAVHHLEVALAHKFIVVSAGILLDGLWRSWTRPDLGPPTLNCH